MQKTAVDIIPQNINYVQCEELTENVQILQCQVLTGIGQTVEDSSGHSDAEPIDGTGCVTDRQWTDCTQ